MSRTNTARVAMAWLRRFKRAQGGLAIAEFALTLPVLITLFYGTIEISRYLLIIQKVEKLSHAVADLSAQSAVATRSSLDQVMVAASDIMNPYAMNSNGRIIVTSLYRPPATPPQTTVASVNWRYEGGGTLNATSQLGNVGANAVVPAGFTFDERENVIAAEVYYRFSPLLTNRFFGTKTIYRRAFYKPRFGALLNAPI